MGVHRGYALVTGASSGIGRCLVRLLCRRGYRVVGVARRAERLEELRRELGNAFSYVVADLALRAALDRVEEAVRELGRLDVLVNNAGYGVGRPVLSHSEDEIEREVLVNMVRPLQLVVRLVRYMGPGGTVVNVLSSGVHVLLGELPVYGAAKAGLAYASKLLRRELEERGIRLIEVYPGATKTEFFKRAGVEEPWPIVGPEKVARAIVDAIESGKSKVYVPRFLAALSVFAPLPIVFLWGKGSGQASK